ncbi:hypothetical protein DFS34DRAFT_140044 [Phlyctochytrium arcticum]|nr:hypothetical protein DFS34DRAFT_140044 [Phlyctochytrium arcticum]
MAGLLLAASALESSETSTAAEQATTATTTTAHEAPTSNAHFPPPFEQLGPSDSMFMQMTPAPAGHRSSPSHSAKTLSVSPHRQQQQHHLYQIQQQGPVSAPSSSSSSPVIPVVALAATTFSSPAQDRGHQDQQDQRGRGALASLAASPPDMYPQQRTSLPSAQSLLEAVDATTTSSSSSPMQIHHPSSAMDTTTDSPTQNTNDSLPWNRRLPQIQTSRLGNTTSDALSPTVAADAMNPVHPPLLHSHHGPSPTYPTYPPYPARSPYQTPAAPAPVTASSLQDQDTRRLSVAAPATTTSYSMSPNLAPLPSPNLQPLQPPNSHPGFRQTESPGPIISNDPSPRHHPSNPPQQQHRPQFQSYPPAATTLLQSTMMPPSHSADIAQSYPKQAPLLPSHQDYHSSRLQQDPSSSSSSSQQLSNPSPSVQQQQQQHQFLHPKPESSTKTISNRRFSAPSFRVPPPDTSTTLYATTQNPSLSTQSSLSTLTTTSDSYMYTDEDVDDDPSLQRKRKLSPPSITSSLSSLEGDGTTLRRANSKKRGTSMEIDHGVDPYASKEIKLAHKRRMNAEAARRCRERKAQRIHNLEDQLSTIEQTNADLVRRNAAWVERERELLGQIAYLKARIGTKQLNHDDGLTALADAAVTRLPPEEGDSTTAAAPQTAPAVPV